MTRLVPLAHYILRPAICADRVWKLVGDTQEEFARRLGVARITVNRWENGEKPSRGPDAYAIRSHAFFRLRGSSHVIEAAASAFVDPKPQARKKPQSYKIEGASLLHAH